MTYPNTQLLIANEWVDAQGGKTLDVLNPATGKTISVNGGLPDTAPGDVLNVNTTGRTGTNTTATGSPTDRMTIGIVLVARWSAWEGGVA